MKLSAIALFLLSSVLFSQQTPVAATPGSTGQVTGRVICADTDQPGRFASVQLIADKSSHAGTSDAGEMDKNPDFKKAVSVVFGTLLKGSDLSALTGIDGSFSMEKVPPGVYLVVAQLPGYQTPLSQFSPAERMKGEDATLKALENAAEKIEVVPNQPVHLNLRLERGAALSGTVRYDDGSPAPTVMPILMALQKDGKWKDMGTWLTPATTDDLGRFRFCGLPAGKYAVKAALPTTQATAGLGPGSFSMHMNTADSMMVFSNGALREKDIKPIEVGPGDHVDGIEVVFPISGLHTISGSVVAKADNHAINKGSILLLDAETKAPVRMAMLGGDGSFRLNYVPDGQYILSAAGAADIERSESGEMESDFARMMNSKTVKSYGDAEQHLLLKSDATGLVLAVPETGAKVAPAE